MAVFMMSTVLGLAEPVTLKDLVTQLIKSNQWAGGNQMQYIDTSKIEMNCETVEQHVQQYM